jgi:hypothetical protein
LFADGFRVRFCGFDHTKVAGVSSWVLHKHHAHYSHHWGAVTLSTRGLSVQGHKAIRTQHHGLSDRCSRAGRVGR